MARKSAVWSAIEAANQRFGAAFGLGDAAGVAQLYAEDGQVLPPQGEPISGRQGIQAFWQGAMNMGLKAAKLESVEVVGRGNSAIEVGKYQLYVAGQQRVDHGKYVVIWKREQGEWMLWRDIWNTSVPPLA